VPQLAVHLADDVHEALWILAEAFHDAGNQSGINAGHALCLLVAGEFYVGGIFTNQRYG
jgi:hypothetical protein